MTGQRDKTSRAGAVKLLGLKATRKLGKLIRDAREAKELTREDVRDRIGLSITSQYNVESGERVVEGKVRPHRVHTGTLVELARLLGLTPVQLSECGRDDAAALLRAPSLPGDWSEEDKARVAGALLLLRRKVPNFQTMINWIGTATGDLPAPDDPPERG